MIGRRTAGVFDKVTTTNNIIEGIQSSMPWSNYISTIMNPQTRPPKGIS